MGVVDVVANAAKNMWNTAVDASKQAYRDGSVTGFQKFVSVDHLRRIGDWARTFTWNIFFEGNDYVKIPTVFTYWMPATEMSIDLAGIESHESAAGNFNISFPKNAPNYKLTITMLDEYRLLIMDWINNWILATVNTRQGYTLPLKDAACKCNIVWFDTKGESVYYGSYYVFPSFTQQIQRNSSSEAVNYQMEFNIVGEAEDIIPRHFNKDSILDIFRGKADMLPVFYQKK